MRRTFVCQVLFLEITHFIVSFFVIRNIACFSYVKLGEVSGGEPNISILGPFGGTGLRVSENLLLNQGGGLLN